MSFEVRRTPFHKILIAKNVLNRPVRTVLTAVGLSVAIAAVIILVGISWNFERSFLAIYRAKKIDLIVSSGPKR